LSNDAMKKGARQGACVNCLQSLSYPADADPGNTLSQTGNMLECAF
jgi:hypothetical protein